MAGGLGSPVDLEQDFVGFDFDRGDLNLISQTRGWTRFAQRIFPGGFIVLAVTMNDEWFLGVRQDHLGGKGTSTEVRDSRDQLEHVGKCCGRGRPRGFRSSSSRRHGGDAYLGDGEVRYCESAWKETLSVGF